MLFSASKTIFSWMMCIGSAGLVSIDLILKGCLCEFEIVSRPPVAANIGPIKSDEKHIHTIMESLTYRSDGIVLFEFPSKIEMKQCGIPLALDCRIVASSVS